MSLLLRKACQPLLDNALLGDYHADVSDHNNLQIVGSCGKPLVVLSGICFGRKAPTNTEIDYAVQLLDDFISQHTDAIHKVLQAKDVLAKTPAPKMPKHISIDYAHSYDDAHIIYNFESLGLYVTYFSDFSEVYLSFASRRERVAIAAVIKALQDKKVVSACKELLTNMQKHWKAQNEYDTLVSALNACDI